MTRTGGVVNAMGPMHTLADLYTACAATVGHQVTGVEVSDAWLQEQEVTPWMGDDSLSLWLPQPDYAGFMARDRSAADRLGLSHRPLLESVRATLAWERERGLDRPRRSGLTPAGEAALLARTGRAVVTPGWSSLSRPRTRAADHEAMSRPVALSTNRLIVLSI